MDDLIGWFRTLSLLQSRRPFAICATAPPPLPNPSNAVRTSGKAAFITPSPMCWTPSSCHPPPVVEKAEPVGISIAAAKIVFLYDGNDIPTVLFYKQEIHSHSFLELAPTRIINGSLWTIASEIYCYTIFFFFAALGLISLRLAACGLICGSILLAHVVAGAF
jgi:hypothetical protein